MFFSALAVGSYPDGFFAADGAFVFTDSAAYTFFDIHVRSLQAYLDGDFSRFFDCLEVFVFSEDDSVFGVAGDLPQFPFVISQVIISGGISSGLEFCVGYLDFAAVDVCDLKLSIANCIVNFYGVDGLWAKGAVFLTNDAGFVHGPWQASVFVEKCGSYSDGAGVGKFFFAVFFVKG